jgi:putative oxidoreductase
LIVYIFVTSGISKATSWGGNVQYMESRHLRMIPVLLGIAMVIELGGSLCLLAGWYARMAGFVLFVYMAVLTTIFHNYWAFTGALAGSQETHFRKNVAIMGGLLMLAYAGAGRWSVDRDRR